MKKTELVKMVTAARDQAQRTVDQLAGVDNPQVVEIVKRSEAAAAAFDAVLAAIKGDSVLLRCMAE
jgi:hypothetical protein